MSAYADFLAAKVRFDTRMGFEVDACDIHPMLKPHQRDIVRWALSGGRRGIFAAFGLGKSFMQLETMRHIAIREGGRQLIVAPLGVRQEFKTDAAKLGMAFTFVRHDHEVTGPGLYLTNYESIRDGRLSVGQFNAASLDEASVLRSFGSKTYQSFLNLFGDVRYRFVATATPSPNRYKELIHYAGFLGVMDTGQALTRWFARDSTKANNLTLYVHKEKEFWLWVNTWAVFLQRPSDLGYSDEGYALPKLHVHYHKVAAGSEPGCDRRGQIKLVNDAALSLADASREKRASLPARIEKLVEIINGQECVGLSACGGGCEACPSNQPAESCIIWHDQEAERHAIKRALPGVVDIHGTMDLDEREDKVMAFSEGRIRLFASKPVLSGSGCNFQRHCAKAVFLGIGFKFNDFIQAIHRIHRFLQERECHSPFHAEAIFHGMRHGFDYLGMITVVTDVVRENNQTYRLGWSEQCKDGTKMGVGSPEYIILLRKPQTDRSKGYADVPVTKDKAEYTRARWQVDAHAFWRSAGDRALTADEMAGFGPDVLARVFTENSLKGMYDYEAHVRIGEELDLRGALPATFMSLAPGSHHPEVWHDVNRMRTLNGTQAQRGLAQHVCPLQFDIVDRLITRYSNPGELVFDPFAGLMTVPYRAVLLGRRGRGVELNADYWRDGVNYLRGAEQKVAAPSLLDFCKAEETKPATTPAPAQPRPATM